MKKYNRRFKGIDFHEAVASKDVDKATLTFTSVLSKRLGVSFNIGNTREYSSNKGDFKGVRATFSDGRSIRFNWKGSNSSVIDSISVWNKPKLQPDFEMEMPQGVSLVKLIDVVQEIIETKGRSKEYAFFEEKVIRERSTVSNYTFKPISSRGSAKDDADSMNAWRQKMFPDDRDFKKAIENQKIAVLYKSSYNFWYSEYADPNEHRYVKLSAFRKMIEDLSEESGIENINKYSVKVSKSQAEIRKVDKSTEKQFKDDLYSLTIEEKFMLLRKKIKRLAQGKINGLAVTGSSGIGKTVTVMDALESEGLSYYKFPGAIKNAESFYETLYKLGGEKKKKVKGKIIKDDSIEADVLLFDDMDSIFKEPSSMQILMGATATDGIRQVSFLDTKKLKSTSLPSQFRMIAKLMVVTNIPMDKLRKMNAGAIASRLTPVDFSVTKQEMIMYIKSQIKDIKPDVYDMNTKNVVWEWVYSELNNITSIDFRFFISVCDIYEDWGGNPFWKKEAYDLLK